MRLSDKMLYVLTLALICAKFFKEGVTMSYNNLTELSKQIFDRAKAQAKITIRSVGNSNPLQETLDKLLKYYDFINSRPEFLSIIFGRPISEVKILNEFVPFILPDSVRLYPNDLKTVNLLEVTDGTFKESDYSFEEFMNLQSDFRRYFKKDGFEDTTSLSSIRVAKSFNEVVNVAAFQFDSEYLVNYGDTPFIPIGLKSNVSALFKKNYFNATTTDCITDFISLMKF